MEIFLYPEKPCKKCGGIKFRLFDNKKTRVTGETYIYKNRVCVNCCEIKIKNKVAQVSKNYVAAKIGVSSTMLSDKDVEDYRSFLYTRRAYWKAVNEKIIEFYPTYPQESVKEKKRMHANVERFLLKQDEEMNLNITTKDMTPAQKNKVYTARWEAKKKGLPMPTAEEVLSVKEFEKKIEETIDLGDNPVASILDDAIKTVKDLNQKLESILSKKEELLKEFETLNKLIHQF